MRITVEKDAYVDGKGRSRVTLVLYKGGRARAWTGVYVGSGDWDKRKRRLKAAARHAILLNKQVEDFLARAELLSMEHPELSPAELRDRLKRPDASGMTFLAITLLDLEETPPRSWHTLTQRRQLATRFDKFTPDVRVRAITPLLFERYHAHIIASGSARNTAATQISKLRTMYNRACKREGVEPKKVLAGVDNVERYAGVPVFLNAGEVDRLKDYARSVTGWAAKAVHMWLFSLYGGGIRWGDLCRLARANVRDARVTFTAGKTGKAKNVELHPEARAILERYSSDPVFGLGTTPQAIAAANVIANRELKIAARLCGINKRLHTHNARHSFAAWALAGGMDDRAIQQVLGVDDRAFRHYRARFSQDAIDEGMRKVLG